MVKGKLKPPAPEAPQPPKEYRRRPVTVYDCVAGRANASGIMLEHSTVSKERRAPYFSHVPIPPDEYLFKQQYAPMRFEEDDIYFADRHLAPHQRLPESDLLKSIHAYASETYQESQGKNAWKFYRSLDETALLTLGILLEEAAVDVFKPSGKLRLKKPKEKEPGQDLEEDMPGERPERPNNNARKRKRDPDLAAPSRAVSSANTMGDD